MGPKPIRRVSLQEEALRTHTHTEGRPYEDTERRRPSVSPGERSGTDPHGCTVIRRNHTMNKFGGDLITP